MIRMIDNLLEKYRVQEKFSISWDAASWHNSIKLCQYIASVNTDDYRSSHQTPTVFLAPLPASAQFLNVIESVFSGMSKSVIRNSDLGRSAIVNKQLTGISQTEINTLGITLSVPVTRSGAKNALNRYLTKPMPANETDWSGPGAPILKYFSHGLQHQS
jgi:hypothetical protein